MQRPTAVSVQIATTSGEDDSGEENIVSNAASTSSTAAATPSDFAVSPMSCHQISVSGASGDSGPEYEPQETIRYSPMYLCPEDFSGSLSRSSPNSAAGSNISIVGSLVTPTRRAYTSSGSGSASGSGWKLRSGRYSKRRGQERTDRERQPSICSDSETDSIGAVHVIDDLHLGLPTTKKWSLPLPMMTRSSESDSASSSWSARSADEGTEDERSPVPSPSASTHSGEYDATIENQQQYLQKHRQSTTSTTSVSSTNQRLYKASVENESRKLAKRATDADELAYRSQELLNISADSKSKFSAQTTECSSVPRSSDENTQGADKSQKLTGRSGAGGRTKKKLSHAAETHRFSRMKTTNYGRCKICDAYVYFWGFECSQCQLICHKKCVKKMAIMCPRAPLPPRASILNLDLESLSTEECVPVLVLKCTQEIEKRSITRPGLYRMTGVASRVEKLLKSFESGPHLIDLSDVSANDLTSVLKVFLRELKDPLITNDLYKEFIDIGRIYRTEAAIDSVKLEIGLLRQLRSAIYKLTPHRFATIRHLLGHLSKVTACQDQNSMSAAAIGIIFAPTIFRPRSTINDLYTEVFEAAPQARVIELLIRYSERIFDESPLDDIDSDCSVNVADSATQQPILISTEESIGAQQQQQQQSSQQLPTVLTPPSSPAITSSTPSSRIQQQQQQHNCVRRTSSNSSAQPPTSSWQPYSGSNIPESDLNGVATSNVSQQQLSTSRSAFTFE